MTNEIEVASIPTTEYGEVIEIRVPIRFYWDKDKTFDGIEFGPFQSKMQEWQEDMLTRCLEAVSKGIENDQE